MDFFLYFSMDRIVSNCDNLMLMSFGLQNLSQTDAVSRALVSLVHGSRGHHRTIDKKSIHFLGTTNYTTPERCKKSAFCALKQDLDLISIGI